MNRLGAVSFVIALIASGQGIDSSEVQVKSQAYVPLSHYTVQMNTKVVEIGVVVRDSRGRVVPGLNRENFQVHDNGKKREITNFAIDSTGSDEMSITQAKESESKASQKPESASKPGAVRERFIALFLDDVNAKDGQHANDLNQTQDAAEKFVKEALQPGVRLGVFTASGAQTLDFTADLGKLVETIKGVRAHVRLSESSCPSPYLAYLIVVRHDSEALDELKNVRDFYKDPVATQCRQAAVSQAEETWRRARELSLETLESIGRVADHLGAMPGSRVLLVASSGFLVATLERERDQIINHALQSGVVINTLDSKGLYGFLDPKSKDVSLSAVGSQNRVVAGLAHNRFEDVQIGLRVDAMNEPLAALSEATGGIFFHDNNNLQAGFQELGDPPKITYRLGFQLHDVIADGSYHKLKVTLVQARSSSVQARPGYYAPTRETTSGPEKVESRFDQEVMAKDKIEDFPIELGAENKKLPNGEMTVSVVAKLDITKLAFARRGDRRTQKIRLVSALIDTEGSLVTGKEATMELALKEGTYNRLSKTGLNAKLTLQVKPGVYELREVVEDAEGRIACSSNTIEIQ